MSIRDLAVVGIATILMAACATVNQEAAKNAPIAQAPTFETGDFFTYKVNDETRVQTFRGTRNGNHLFDVTSQRWGTFDVELNNDLSQVKRGTKRVFEPDDGILRFPLKVGNSWTQRYTIVISGSERITRNRNCTVTDYRTVTVPAGTFKSHIISCRNQRVGRQRPAHESYAYSTAVGMIVQYQSAELGLNRKLLGYSKK